MDRTEQFRQTINEGHTFKGDHIVLGAAMLDGQAVADAQVKIRWLPSTATDWLQAQQEPARPRKRCRCCASRSAIKGISVLIMDIKGDVSGMAMPGTANPKIDERMQKIGSEWNAKAIRWS